MGNPKAIGIAYRLDMNQIIFGRKLTRTEDPLEQLKEAVMAVEEAFEGVKKPVNHLSEK